MHTTMNKSAFTGWLTSNGKIQYLAGILGCLTIVVSSMHYGWSSPYLPVLQSGNYTYQISSVEASYIVVMPVFGEAFGAIINGMTIDYIGRKNTILISTFPYVATWLIIGLASSSTVLFIGRFIVGLTDGLVLNALPIYMGEIADAKVRGQIASLTPIAVVLGVLIIYIVGAYLPLDTASFILISLPLFVMITFPWMPETPYFYLMKGKHNKAEKSLKLLRGIENVDEELKRISEAVREQNKNRGRLMDLFTVNSNRKGLIICMGLRCLQQLIGYATIIFYSKTILEESSSFISADNATMIFGAVQLILSIFTSFVVDISGRRPLLMISLCGTAISHSCNAVFLYMKAYSDVDLEAFNFIPFACILLYSFFYSFGMHNIPLLMMSELFPTNIKAFALCVTHFMFTIVLTIVSKFFHWSHETFGMHIPFTAFAISSVIGAVFVYYIVPETKGKTLEDIQIELGVDKKILRPEKPV